MPRGRVPLPVLLVRLVAAGAVLASLVAAGWGASYYLAPLTGRVRHPLHPLLRPSGTIGQGLGLLALSLFLFLWLYPLRKKLGARAASAGGVGAWLEAHVAAGLVVPLVAATHAGFRFTGLIGLGYGSMFVVWLSGLVGRYLYLHLPRSRTGLEMGREEVAAERRALVPEIAAATGLPITEVAERLAVAPAGRLSANPLRVVAGMVTDDLDRRRAVRDLAAAWRRRSGPPPRETLAAVRRLARREVALAQQVRMLDAARAVFGYWHAAHKPFAITAVLAVLLHVAVAVAMGATWFR